MAALLSQQEAQVQINKEVQVRIAKFETDLATMKTAMDMEKQASEWWRRELSKDISRVQPCQPTLSEATPAESTTSSVSSQEETIEFAAKNEGKQKKMKISNLFWRKKRKAKAATTQDSVDSDDTSSQHSSMSLSSDGTDKDNPGKPSANQQ